MNLLINLCLALFVLVSLVMVLVILMQRPKSEGLGAAFGGAVTDNIFGAQTTNVLVKFTAWLAGIFFFLTFALSVLYARHSGGESSLTRELKKVAPASAASPAPGASLSPSAQGSPGAPAGAGSSNSAAPAAPAANTSAPAAAPAAGSPAVSTPANRPPPSPNHPQSPPAKP